MSKWSIYRRRGGTRYSGAAPAPGTDDWSVEPGIAEHVTVERLADVPYGLTHWGFRQKNHLAATWGSTTIVALSTYDLNWGASGDLVDFQIGWSDGSNVVTEWSDVKSVTTL